MCAYRMMLGVGVSLLLVAATSAQTPEIQKQIEKKLDQMKKDAAALDELLAEALKHNPDIRVAEAKLREAEAELLRARSTVLTRIAIARAEIDVARAAANEAASRYERDKALSTGKSPAIAAAELSASFAAMQKFKADVAVKEAELEGLIGKNSGKAAGALSVTNKALEYLALQFAQPAAPVQTTMADKLRKALDRSVEITEGAAYVDGGVVLDLLRKYTKGVNIQDNLAKHDAKAKLQLKEPIPLGAFFEWAEDQFQWRFIIRDYGIVVTERSSVPPAGALMLLDFWRKSKETAAP
jgi:hypothetical protein